MNKKINPVYFYIFLIVYLEILVKIFITKSTNGSLYTFIFSLPLILFLYLITNILKEKGNKRICLIITFLISTIYSFYIIFCRLFSNIFSFNTITLAKDIGEFNNLIMDIIIKNSYIILLCFIPFILLSIFSKIFNFQRLNLKKGIITITIFITLYITSILSMIPNKKAIYSPYNLYFKINSEYKTVETFGLASYIRLDLKRIIFGFDAQINDENSLDAAMIRDLPTTEEISYNKVEINFEELINNESNQTIKEMLEYFQESEPTNKNKYTGMFKDKNLIFILAEGFNMIAVDEKLTPTLYKLTHEGFNFNNFYSPVFLSTTGGEFQATTGLIPTQEVLLNWKKQTPTIKYALGNSFAPLGYTASSFHDWTYTYYVRNKTMPTLGFHNYMGCGNGLENLMSCKWLPSDIDMIDVTFPLYKDYEKFVTYYVSVSGHAPYVYNNSGNSISQKNTEYVKDLPYSKNVLAYLATQIEFERALEKLIANLEAEGLLEDTVISFVGDHYPYTLTTKEINELSSYNRDETVEVNHSNFVIWNPSIKESISIDKVGSQIDVLPTLLNLFGIEYDSRLIIGKDILSDTPGLAIFSNRSWVTDYGTYKNGKFTLNSDKELEDIEEYIASINNTVANKFTISNQIIKYNMYEYILKEQK